MRYTYKNDGGKITRLAWSPNGQVLAVPSRDCLVSLLDGATGQARMRLEGHTDEQGSREYNIGLGERRAQAVRQVLMLQGVSATQITTVSYGEERPAVSGSDEEAWSLNRRVVIVHGN